MIAGKKYLGNNVDIWSCGIIMYALICGYLPFDDPNTANLYKVLIILFLIIDKNFKFYHLFRK